MIGEYATKREVGRRMYLLDVHKFSFFFFCWYGSTRLTISLSFHVRLVHLVEKRRLVPTHIHTLKSENFGISNKILWIIFNNLTASYPLISEFLSGPKWMSHISHTHICLSPVLLLQLPNCPLHTPELVMYWLTQCWLIHLNSVQC